ncbi:MAG: hypothetical protein IPK82_44100 [Polyangiaceae bacterium]|nr:hypothetical protein [Polyangiaceae bacterium]
MNLPRTFNDLLAAVKPLQTAPDEGFDTRFAEWRVLGALTFLADEQLDYQMAATHAERVQERAGNWVLDQCDPLRALMGNTQPKTDAMNKVGGMADEVHRRLQKCFPIVRATGYAYEALSAWGRAWAYRLERPGRLAGDLDLSLEVINGIFDYLVDLENERIDLFDDEVLCRGARGLGHLSSALAIHAVRGGNAAFRTEKQQTDMDQRARELLGHPIWVDYRWILARGEVPSEDDLKQLLNKPTEPPRSALHQVLNAVATIRLKRWIVQPDTKEQPTKLFEPEF